VPVAIDCGPHDRAVRHQYAFPEAVKILHGRTVRVSGGVLLPPQQSLHEQAVRIYNDGLIRTSNAQRLFEAANPGNEIYEKFAAGAVRPERIAPPPVGIAKLSRSAYVVPAHAPISR
jgi:hypothetical protein